MRIEGYVPIINTAAMIRCVHIASSNDGECVLFKFARALPALVPRFPFLYFVRSIPYLRTQRASTFPRSSIASRREHIYRPAFRTRAILLYFKRLVAIL